MHRKTRGRQSSYMEAVAIAVRCKKDVVLAGVDDCRKVRIERDVRCPIDESAFAKILEPTFRALNGAQQSMRTIRMGSPMHL
jgi:hypothetical protein